MLHKCSVANLSAEMVCRECGELFCVITNERMNLWVQRRTECRKYSIESEWNAEWSTVFCFHLNWLRWCCGGCWACEEVSLAIIIDWLWRMFMNDFCSKIECDAHEYDFLGLCWPEWLCVVVVGLSATAVFDRYNFRSEPINLCMQKCSAVKCGTGVLSLFSFHHHFTATQWVGYHLVVAAAVAVIQFVRSQSACASFIKQRVCVCSSAIFQILRCFFLFHFSTIIFFLLRLLLLLLRLFIIRCLFAFAWATKTKRKKNEIMLNVH